MNPDTGEKLEFDRYYPKDDVALEFHGSSTMRPPSAMAKER